MIEQSPELHVDRPFLIVGAGSSGSTLLSVLLDRHPQLACGPELSVFNKRRIYDNWRTFQRNFPLWLQRGLSTDGQAEYREFFFNLEAYFFKKADLIKLVKEATSHREFFDRFFQGYLRKRGKSIWGEKTGSNAYCIKEFIKLYPRARIIHLIRDGRDAVVSLMRRPYSSAYHCVSHWLYNVSAAIACRDMDEYLEVRYENLVSDPQNVLKTICHHLGVEFDQRMVKSESDQDTYWQQFSSGNVHPSWKQTPFSRTISMASTGRYKKDLTKEVEALFWNVHLTPLVRKRSNIQQKGNRDLMKLLGYVDQVPNRAQKISIEDFHSAVREYWQRFKRELNFEGRLWFPLTYIKWGG